MKVSIIIINFNTKKITENCIESIYSSTKCNFEIILIDNSTIIKEKFPLNYGRAKVIYSENNGFGHACNVGIAESCGEYLLMLNSDTIVHPEAIDRCLEYISTYPYVGAIGGKTLLEDGSFDDNCKRGLPTPSASLYYLLGIDKKHPNSTKYSRYKATYLDNDKINEVEVLSGAFIMFPSTIIKKVGGFDEQFFMYCEDVDLCYRISQSGYKLIYLPTAVITHLKGKSGLSSKNRKIIWHFHKSMIIFYKKHFAKKYNFFVSLAVYTGIFGKYVLTILKSFLHKR